MIQPALAKARGQSSELRAFGTTRGSRLTDEAAKTKNHSTRLR